MASKSIDGYSLVWMIKAATSALWQAGEPLFRALAGFLLFVWICTATWPLVPAVLSMVGAFAVGRVIRDMRSQRNGW